VGLDLESTANRVVYPVEADRKAGLMARYVIELLRHNVYS